MSVKCPTTVGRAVGEFLRRRHPRRTAECVAADLHPSWGIKVATISKLLERQSKPSFDLALALVGAYGPEFLSSVYPGELHWLRAASAKQEREMLRRQLDDIEQRLSALS